MMLVADTDVCELLETLRRSNVDMLGESLDVTATRRTVSLWANLCTSPTDDCSQPQQLPLSSATSLLNHEKCSHLLALRRTLKVLISIFVVYSPFRLMIYNLHVIKFLADRTARSMNGSWHDTIVCLSVCQCVTRCMHYFMAFVFSY